MSEVLGAILAELCGRADLLVKTDAPAKIYTTLYREGDTTFLHVLNGLGSGAMPEDAETPKKPLYPALEADIHFRVLAPKAAKVYAVSPDFAGQKALAFTRDENNLVSFVLPKELLKVYTVIHIQ